MPPENLTSQYILVSGNCSSPQTRSVISNPTLSVDIPSQEYVVPCQPFECSSLFGKIFLDIQISLKNIDYIILERINFYFIYPYIILIELGWLDRIFGKKEEEKFEETKMSLKEVEYFIANKMKKDFEPLKESAKKEYANLQLVAGTMQEQLEILIQAPYSERTYPILIRKSVGSRKTFVYKMRSLVKQIQKPIGEDMISILNFHNETAKLINITNAKTLREYAFVKELFEKEAEKILQSFRQIVEIDKRLGNIVKEFIESNAQLLKIQKVAAEVLKLTEELKKKDEAEGLEEILKEIGNKSKKVEDELKRLLDSNEWKTFLEMQRIREDMKISLQNKKSDFTQSVTKMETPLKKYKWSVENRILDDYVQHSFESILSEDPKGEVFMSTIKDMKIKIIEGKMDLKDSDKFLAVIERMIEDNIIGKILEEYLKLSEALKNQEEKIALQEVPKRKSNLESEMSKLKGEVEETKAEKKRVEERIRRMQRDKEQKLKELGNLLNDVDDKRILLEVN